MTTRNTRSRSSNANPNPAQGRHNRTPKINDFVEIWWGPMKRFYRGTLQPGKNANTFSVIYDDGEKEDVINLNKEIWRFADQSRGSKNSSDSVDDDDADEDEEEEEEILDESTPQDIEQQNQDQKRLAKKPSSSEKSTDSNKARPTTADSGVPKQDTIRKNELEQPIKSVSSGVADQSDKKAGPNKIDPQFSLSLDEESEELEDPTYHEEDDNMPKLSKKGSARNRSKKSIQRPQTRASGPDTIRKRIEKLPRRASSLAAKKHISVQAAREVACENDSNATPVASPQSSDPAKEPVSMVGNRKFISQKSRRSVSGEGQKDSTKNESSEKKNTVEEVDAAKTDLKAKLVAKHISPKLGPLEMTKKSALLRSLSAKTGKITPEIPKAPSTSNNTPAAERVETSLKGNPIDKPPRKMVHASTQPSQSDRTVFKSADPKVSPKTPTSIRKVNLVDKQDGSTDKGKDKEDEGGPIKSVTEFVTKKNKFQSEIRSDPGVGATTPQKIAFKPAKSQSQTAAPQNASAKVDLFISKNASVPLKIRVEKQIEKKKGVSSPRSTHNKIAQKNAQPVDKIVSLIQEQASSNMKNLKATSAVPPVPKKVSVKLNLPPEVTQVITKLGKRGTPDSENTDKNLQSKKPKADHEKEITIIKQKKKVAGPSSSPPLVKKTASGSNEKDRPIQRINSPELMGSQRGTQLLIKAMGKISRQVELNGNDARHAKQTAISMQGEVRKELGSVKTTVQQLKKEVELGRLENEKGISELQENIEKQIPSLVQEMRCIFDEVKGFRAEVKKQMLEIRADLHEMKRLQSERHSEVKDFARTLNRVESDISRLRGGSDIRMTSERRQVPDMVHISELRCPPESNPDSMAGPYRDRGYPATRDVSYGGYSARRMVSPRREYLNGSSSQREMMARGRVSGHNPLGSYISVDHGGKSPNMGEVWHGGPGSRSQGLSDYFDNHERNVIKGLIARQTTVWLLETPHEYDMNTDVAVWLKTTVARVFRGVVARLKLFADYHTAYKTLCSGLANDNAELDWFLHPSNDDFVNRARMNYTSWDPLPTNDEWSLEKRLLKAIGNCFAQAFRGFTPKSGDRLAESIMITQLSVENVERMDFDAY